MKKLSMFLLVAALLAVSCSKKDTKPNSDPGNKDTTGIIDVDPIPNEKQNVLPVRFELTQPTENGDTTDVINITYVANSNKLKKIEQVNGHTETYFYKGNEIDSIDFGGGYYKKFQYLSDKTIETYYRENEPYEKTEFIKESDNKLKFINYAHANSSGEFVQDEEPVHIELDSKGNVKKGYQGSTWDNAGLRITATVNDKYSPMANVLGWRQINYVGGIPLGDNVGFEDLVTPRNNFTKIVAEIEGENMTVLFQYEYEDAKYPDFPTKIKLTAEEGDIVLKITYKQD